MMSNGVSKKLILLGLTEYHLYQLAIAAETQWPFAAMMTVLAIVYGGIQCYLDRKGKIEK